MDKEFMSVALKEALKVMKLGDLPVGAIVELNGKIIGRGSRSHGRLDHAEITALRSATPDRTKEECRQMTIYTTLEPCVMCFGTILNCGIGRIVYAMEDAYGGALKIPSDCMPPRHQKNFPLILGGVMREEAKEILRTFFNTTNHPFWLAQSQNPLVLACTS